jgi:hypothetical protein
MVFSRAINSTENKKGEEKREILMLKKFVSIGMSNSRGTRIKG